MIGLTKVGDSYSEGEYIISGTIPKILSAKQFNQDYSSQPYKIRF